MVEIAIDTAEFKFLMAQLEAFQGDGIRMAVIRATNRAAKHVRMEAVKAIRGAYTMKAGDIKKKTKTKNDKSALETVIRVRGPMEKIEQYKAKERSKGVFAAIKRGKMVLVPRSFRQEKKFLARSGKERYPVHGLFGPAVPQLFGNADVVDVSVRSGMNMYEKRLRHELERMVSKK